MTLVRNYIHNPHYSQFQQLKYTPNPLIGKLWDLLNLSDNILRFLGIKKAPHFTTIQKFFQKVSETKLKEINKLNNQGKC